MPEQKISVIGSGAMGRGIAQVALQAGYTVLLYDSVPEAAANALKIINKKIGKMAEKGELDSEAAAEMSRKLVAAQELEEVAGSDFVLEAIIEDRAEKKELFQKLDALVNDQAVMASNTSSIPITDLASVTRRPENVIGMHFMNPVPLMTGVEIIRGLKTSDATYRKTVLLAESLSKEPIYSSDQAGFVINRILMPLINEAITVVDQGTSTIEDVDKGAVHCLNHPLGPLALSDLIGNDTTLHILSVLHQELGERFRPAPLLTRMVEAGLFGNKTGAGFYIWENNKPVKVNTILKR